MQSQRINALRYFRAGGTAEAAGYMCAEQYHLYSSRETDREWAEGMAEDIQECLRTNGGNLDYLRRVYGRLTQY
jgi:nucleoside 2-deoxyribosyltransferase